MSYIEDVPQLMSERYNLMLSRERWRGTGTGALLCNSLLIACDLAALVAGTARMPFWAYAIGPVVSLVALWRHHRVCNRVDAIDGGFRDAVKLAPQPMPKEGLVN